jgi:hypothetical protein
VKGPVRKICERCLQAFECGQYGCWCGTIGITEQQMDWISARFGDCLCPDCLGQVLRGETGSVESSSIP